MNKVYLGDSVYVQQEENGYRDDPRNRIVLETQTLINLLIYLKQARIESQRLKEE